MASHNTNSGTPEQDPFAALWNGGYRFIVPITPPDAEISENSSIKLESRGKAPGVRGHSGWHSFDWLRHETTEEDLSRWQRMGAGVGIRTGLQHDGTYLIAVDADTLDPRCASIISHHIRSKFGFVPTRIGRAPKCLYLIRTSGPVPYTRIEFAHKERVELLGDGRQFVAAGIHPATREPYHWPQPLKPLSALPIVEPQELIDLLQGLRLELPEATAVVQEGGGKIPPQESLRGDPKLVRAAIAALPNTSDAFPTRESYLAVGYAIKASLPDDQDLAYELWCQWAARWPGYVNEKGEHVYNTPQTIEKDWSGMKPPFKRGAHFLYELADKHGDGQFNMAALYFDVVNEEDENPFAVAAENERQGQQESVESIRWIDPMEWHGRPRPEQRWIVEGVIPDGEVTMLTGKGGVGKTLLAQQGATCISLGLPWLGRPTQQCKVMMFLCEDPEDILHGRQIDINMALGAEMADISPNLRIASRKYMDNLLALWDRNVGEMKRTVVFNQLLRDAQAFGAKCVWIDTAADTFGGEENNRQQVRQFIQSCLGRLAKELEGSVVLLAHPSRAGESSGEGTSGSTAWHGSVRSRLYLDYATKDGRGDMRKLVNMKANYAAKGDAWMLRWTKGTFEVVSGTSMSPEAFAHIPSTESEIERGVLLGLVELAAEGAALSLIPNSSNRVGTVLLRRFKELNVYGREAIEQTVVDLLKAGKIRKGVVGKSASRHPIEGFVVVSENAEKGPNIFD